MESFELQSRRWMEGKAEAMIARSGERGKKTKKAMEEPETAEALLLLLNNGLI